MQSPKYIPVFTIRLPLAGQSLAFMGDAQIGVDGRVPRELMVKMLEHAVSVLKGGRSPAEIAALKLLP